MPASQFITVVQDGRSFYFSDPFTEAAITTVINDSRRGDTLENAVAWRDEFIALFEVTYPDTQPVFHVGTISN